MARRTDTGDVRRLSSSASSAPRIRTCRAQPRARLSSAAPPMSQSQRRPPPRAPANSGIPDLAQMLSSCKVRTLLTEFLWDSLSSLRSVVTTGSHPLDDAISTLRAFRHIVVLTDVCRASVAPRRSNLPAKRQSLDLCGPGAICARGDDGQLCS